MSTTKCIPCFCVPGCACATREQVGLTALGGPRGQGLGPPEAMGKLRPRENQPP